jgi:hypothetical protein
MHRAVNDEQPPANYPPRPWTISFGPVVNISPPIVVDVLDWPTKKAEENRDVFIVSVTFFRCSDVGVTNGSCMIMDGPSYTLLENQIFRKGTFPNFFSRFFFVFGGAAEKQRNIVLVLQYQVIFQT